MSWARCLGMSDSWVRLMMARALAGLMRMSRMRGRFAAMSRARHLMPVW